MADGEVVTFKPEPGSEYDVVRKDWGYYDPPSLNGRLEKFGLRALLVKSQTAKCFVLLVERGKEADLQHYLNTEGHVIVCWLDSDATLATLENSLKGAPR